MPTVQEILKSTGLTDEQIAALDAKVVPAFTQVMSAAEKEREAAQLAQRATAQTFENEISPALDAWANDKANLEAQLAYYKAQAEGAIAGGFTPKPAPGAQNTPAPKRDAGGQFVAGQNTVPGSPAYLTKDEGYNAISNSTWFVTEFMRLNNGAPPPDDIESLAKEANVQRMPFRDFVSKKYDFGGKREAIKAEAQKKHDDEIRKEVSVAKDKEWSEKIGNNPNVRIAETSRFAEIDKAVKSGERKDPLMMSRDERHRATSQIIQKEIAENSTVQ